MFCFCRDFFTLKKRARISRYVIGFTWDKSNNNDPNNEHDYYDNKGYNKNNLKKPTTKKNKNKKIVNKNTGIQILPHVTIGHCFH